MASFLALTERLTAGRSPGMPTLNRIKYIERNQHNLTRGRRALAAFGNVCFIVYKITLTATDMIKFSN